MFLIERLSKKIVSYVYKNTILEYEELEIIQYGSLITLLQTINIFTVVTIGFILKIPIQATTFYFIVCLLRKYSGGVHSTSPNTCIIIGTLISVLIPLFISKIYINIININYIILLDIILIISCYYTILKLAPIDSIEKPIKDKNLRKRFKSKSIKTMIINTLCTIILICIYIKYNHVFLLDISQCIIYACLWQCYTLTKFGHKTISVLDNILNYIFEVIKNENHI